MNKKLSPSDGGCWFCNREILDNESCGFTLEFDAWLHIECLEREVASLIKANGEWNDRETEIIAKEFYGENFRERFNSKLL